ncbi:hypothetical protein GCM10011376_03140 [Nocardioides flavus (ex Wang et al. 2016)]|uniref:DUF1772 domain-containing protein n=1 Tax=Nocardioides flavus (ex Wang et al. 2016) TaxID=2058780 RepID=A0ABQ3HI14_9ACTN|nr:hypothetical protein [Nocardioides flavus (ex Wang et al. 2016)]GHE15355.1 hypothetical protein GCM10011376_03140 [Nocardioides flavus (ex Wang et al. 2016)]
MSLTEPGPWLLVVAAAHLGFQLTVDLVVYPALGDTTDDAWDEAHARHSRRIAPLVGLLYVPLVALLAWTVAVEPQAVGTWLATVGGALAVVTTAALAAPMHGRLAAVAPAERRDLLRTLDRVDRVRTAGAVVCLAGAVLLAG